MFTCAVTDNFDIFYSHTDNLTCLVRHVILFVLLEIVEELLTSGDCESLASHSHNKQYR